MKVAVIGLDSADWTLLDRWSAHLPNITAIRREGVSGPLESCRPPVTIPAWKCYSTGKYPGKLGVFWFAHPDFGARRIQVNLPGEIGGSIWDYVPKSLVINTPGTFPPRTIDGTIVCGFPYIQRETYATPASVRSQLTGYMPASRLPPDDPGYPEETQMLIASRFSLFRRLAPQHQFGQVTIYSLDELHHTRGSDQVVLDAWRLVDEEIGRIMELAANVVLVSDHGSGPLEYVSNVVPCLEGIGAIRPRGNSWRTNGLLGRRTGEKVAAGFAGDWAEVLPPDLRDTIASRTGPLQDWLPTVPDQFRIQFDWSSAVLPLSQGLVYRNPRSRDLRPSMRDVADALRKVPGVTRIWRKEELYPGPFLAAAPDFWIEAEPGVEIVARFDERWVTQRPEAGKGWVGNHRQDGIYAFYGKDIESTDVGRARIVDMCPTILSLYGIAPNESMDGSVLPVAHAIAPAQEANGIVQEG